MSIGLCLCKSVSGGVDSKLDTPVADYATKMARYLAINQCFVPSCTLNGVNCSFE